LHTKKTAAAVFFCGKEEAKLRMKFTVLVDNNTIIDQYYGGEPAVSYFIECDGQRYLFDAGYSDLLLRNAEKMKIDLLDLTAVIISHGHDDHVRGLQYLAALRKAQAAGIKKPLLIGHAAALFPKRDGDLAIGSPLTGEELGQNFSLQLSRGVQNLSEKLLFLGEVPRSGQWEQPEPIGEVFSEGCWQPDFVLDDSALVYKGEQGLVIITGCSHAGICNIIEYAKKVSGDDRIQDVIGGFHLLQAPAAKLAMTKAYLKELQPQAVHAGHCTDFQAKCQLAAAVNLQEIGVGMILQYD
jgi:7,8-dihydropterin-6-yl-methyl-4-(beta-D-ribofuranosyl)aminobenzene 5'-phosphate synthase